MVAAMQMGLCCITRRRGQIRGSVCLGFSLGGCEPGHQISRRHVVSCCARAGPIEATTQSVFLQAGQPPFDEYRQRNRLRGKFAVCGDGFDDGRGPVFRRPKGHGSFAGRICRGWEAVPIPDAPDLSVVQPPDPPRRAPPRSRRSRIGDRSRDGAAGFGRSAASYSRLRRGGRSRSGERLGLLAQRDVAPLSMRFDHRPRSLRFEIDVEQHVAGQADIIAAKAGAIVSVRSVRWLKLWSS